jgi:hypothetical protein
MIKLTPTARVPGTIMGLLGMAIVKGFTIEDSGAVNFDDIQYARCQFNQPLEYP